MSNILIFNHSEIIDRNQYQNICYTEGLIKAFLIRGHKVKNIITNNYLYDPWCGLNILKDSINYKTLLKKIKDFNPNLIISFNNSKLPHIEKELECPIVIWEADKFYYFSDKINLKKNSSRYFYFSSSLNGHNQFIKYFGAKKEKIFFMPHATSIKSRIIKQDKKISFLGKLYDMPVSKNKSYSQIKLNALYRKNILLSIHDFGLKIFTNTVPGFYEDLRPLCNVNMLNYSILHNEKIFNSSNISLNVSHLQAKDNTVSYRAIDIMASNSLLISENSKYLEFFSKKLSRIFYNTPFDLKKKVDYFLKNPNARKDMISIQNEITKNNFLWIDRIKDIEQFFGLKKNTINLTSNKAYSNLVNQSNKLNKLTTVKNTNLLVVTMFFILMSNKFLHSNIIYVSKSFVMIIKKKILYENKYNLFYYYIYKFIIYMHFILLETKKRIKKT
jgi:hypothetical protein